VNKLIYVFSSTSIGFRGCFLFLLLIWTIQYYKNVEIWLDLNLSTVTVSGVFKNGGGAEIYFCHE
jgi:hypothetical protein